MKTRKMGKKTCICVLLTSTILVVVYAWALTCIRLKDESRMAQKSRIARSQLLDINCSLDEYHRSSPRQLQPVSYALGRTPHLGVSWRVYLLPYLDSKNAFDHYNKNEPWNSDHNIQLELRANSLYTYNEVETNTNRCHTRLVAIIPSHGQWLPNHGYGKDTSAISETYACPERDGKEYDHYRAIILETDKSNIHWMEPRDYPASWVSPHINSSGPYSIVTDSRNGVSVLMSDGSVRNNNKNTSPSIVKTLLGN